MFPSVGSHKFHEAIPIHVHFHGAKWGTVGCGLKLQLADGVGLAVRFGVASDVVKR
jgi:hypothetical protein